MAGIKVQLTGFKELQERLKKASEKMPKEVDAELSDAANEIRLKALQDAPADQGLLRAELQTTQASFLNWNVFSNALYSGYQEFGTKSKVSVPAGLEAVAAELKGGGSSLGAKEAIYAWCKRKGIEERFWWPIFIKIMVTGIKPHPYFFKQLEVVQPQLLKRIENILKNV